MIAGMAATRGTRWLGDQGVAFVAHAYEFRSKGAAYAAEALAIEPERMAKSLVVRVDESFVFALVPGSQELSLRELARAAGGKRAELATQRDAERLTGYQIGGISPFGSRKALPVYAVAEWLEHELVALNGGARGCIVELAVADLIRLLEPTPIQRHAK